MRRVGAMSNRGCCCCDLELCVRIQGLVVGAVCALNVLRVLLKVTHPEDVESPIKQTAAGVYLDGLDYLINGMGAAMLLCASIMLTRGVLQKRPALLQPYLVVAATVAVGLAVQAIVFGVAVVQALPMTLPDPGDDLATAPGLRISVGEVGAMVVAVILLLIAFPTYCLLNVSSLYDSMIHENYRMEHFYYIGT